MRPRPLVVERLTHLPGELLRARDLRDQLTTDTELLWWHQRAVHHAAGVVRGLVVETVAGGPVTVGPGLGYDPRGRELVVPEALVTGLPDGGSRGTDPGERVLVLHRADRGAAAIAWLHPGQVGRCAGIVLARLDPDAPNGVRPTAVRARPVARPLFASGQTVPGATAWEPWLGLGRRGAGVGVQVHVDTAPAGFGAAPCYFAWLRWPEAAAPGARPGVAGFGLQHLAGETARGFTFRLLVVGPRLVLRHDPAATPRSLRVADAAGLVTFARTERLSVAWVGIDDDHRSGGST